MNNKAQFRFFLLIFMGMLLLATTFVFAFETSDVKLADNDYRSDEMISNSLSQLPDFIYITGAKHLDENRNSISNIYDEVKVRDENWSEAIDNNEYVRVTFEMPLDSSRDITFYGRSVGNETSSVEVYAVDGTEALATFNDVSGEGWHKIYLTKLNGTQNVFDLKVLGSVEFDYIVDPVTPFNSTWDTTKTGTSNSTQITLPLESTGIYNFTVYWGDGANDLITVYNQAEVTHNYATSGTYNVSINGTIQGFRFNNGGDKLKITDISNWGVLNVGNNNGYFRGCNNLNSSATDALNLSGTTDLSNMFSSNYNFNGDISNWNTSSVVNMSNMFNHATYFNSNISNWDTSSVTDMSVMFYADVFNQPLNSWDTSSVTNMNGMFFNDNFFNQSLSSWDTSSVTDMSYVFRGAISFNQDLSNWDTSSVTDMSLLFLEADNFSGNISNWNTSSVTDMNYMFYGATSFNQPLNNWDTSSVTDMSGMFYIATSFDRNIGDWNVSAVTTMADMFNGANLSIANYNSLLVGWAGLPSLQSSVTFDGGNSKYSSAATSARNDTLIGVYGWTITDGGWEDLAVPLVIIVSPENTTYSTNAIWFNLTANSSSSSIDLCWYNIDGGANVSMSASGDNYSNLNSSVANGGHIAYFFCNDSVGNLNNSENIHFTVAVASAVTSSDSTTATTRTYAPSPSQILGGYNVSLYESDRIRLSINDDIYYFKVDSISGNFVKVVISDDLISLDMTIGDSEKVDLDSDGYYDLLINLKSVTNSKGNFVLTTINELIGQEASEPISGDSASGEIVSDEIPEDFVVANYTWLWVISALIIILVVVWKKGLFGRVRKKK